MMVPNGWSLIKLGDVLKLGSGDTKPTDLQKEFSDDSPYPVYGGNNIMGYSSQKNSSGFVILIGRVGEYCGVTRYIDKACWITDNALYTKSVSSDIDKEYLVSKLKKFDLSRLRNKGGQPLISQKPIYAVKLPMPPLPEQRKIAKILSTWDKAISTTERLIDNSKQQKKALMQQLLTGKKRLLDDSGRPFEGEWEDVSLESISEIMTDYVANGSFQSLRENVVVTDEVDHSLYVRLTDLRVGLGHRNQKYTSKESYEFLKKSCLFGGELLMANIGANVGEVWQMPEVNMPATLAPNMLMTKFKQRANSRYVYYFLSSSFGQNRISAVIAGSGHPKINKTELKQVKILLPSFKEQQKIAFVLTNADREIELLEQQFANLKQEKKALMQQLLTGKRRVKVDDKEVA